MHDAVKCQSSSKQKHSKFVTAKEATSAAAGTPDMPDKGSVTLFSVSSV